MNRSETINKLALALVKFNNEVSSIPKDAKNPFYHSEYVTLDKLIISTRDILQKNGLSVMQFPLSVDGKIGIQTILLHESGEFIESEPIFMKPAKANDPQQAGSIISYMRRYSYQAILNLNTGEDDDANKSTSEEDKKSKLNNKSYSNDRLISDAQRNRLNIIAKGIDVAVVKDIIAGHGFDSSKDITMSKYNAICDEIEGLKNNLGA